MNWSRGPRRFSLGLRTLFGSKSHGYFIPSRAAGYRSFDTPGTAYPFSAERFQSAEPEMMRYLSIADGYADEFDEIQQNDSTFARWDQDWFPRLDAALLYSFIRHFKPERIVEVGSGHSTRFAQKAMADEGLACSFTAIDPHPRKPIPTADNFTWMAKPAQAVAPEFWTTLRDGDFLIIDSSHVLMPGSDVDVLLNKVLPALPGGVIVQIHDILLPDDYPSDWAWRGYNEQLGVVSYLKSRASEILISSHYVTTRLQAEFGVTKISKLMMPKGARETSLWIRMC